MTTKKKHFSCSTRQVSKSWHTSKSLPNQRKWWIQPQIFERSNNKEFLIEHGIVKYEKDEMKPVNDLILGMAGIKVLAPNVFEYEMDEMKPGFTMI